MAAVFYFSFNLSSMIKNLTDNAARVKNSTYLGCACAVDGGRHYGGLGAVAGLCLVLHSSLCFGGGWPWPGIPSGCGGLFCAIHADHYRLSPQTASGQKKALLKKEMQRFFGTPMYFWNAGIGLVMLLAAGVASLVMKENCWLMWRCPESICHCSLWQRQSLVSVSASAPLPRLRLAWKENTSGSCGNPQ